MISPRNSGEVITNNVPKRHNLNTRHNSVDNLTPVKNRVNNPRYPGGGRRARDLEQHLRDKYGLGGGVVNNDNKNLRRTNSHSSLVQYAPDALIRPPPPTQPVPKTLHRRKSFEPDFGPKSLAAPQFTHLHQHQVGSYEARDSKLRYLGRMSPEEQVDKYLKSVEKVNAEKEARLRRLKQRELSMHLESHTDYRTTFDPSKHVSNPQARINSSIGSRWHSLDSVTRPVLAKNVNNIMKKQKTFDSKKQQQQPPARVVNAKPPSAAPRQSNPYHRERTDLPKSFASMPQIGMQQKRKSSESSVSPIRKTPEEKMSTGSDNKSRTTTPPSDNDNHTDDYVDSCSCTDVTLDETLKINHNHRKSLARKKKLQAQRLRELQKAETSNENRNSKNDNQPPPLQSGVKANYLGSITLDSKSSDLLSLQKPLKSLYFKYVIAQQAGLDPINGSLEITRTGLKVRENCAYVCNLPNFHRHSSLMHFNAICLLRPI